MERHHVTFHLYALEAHGYVKDNYVKKQGPFNPRFLCHEFQLTEEGERVLREGGPTRKVFLPDASLPVSNAKVESVGDQSTAILGPRGIQASEANYGAPRRRVTSCILGA